MHLEYWKLNCGSLPLYSQEEEGVGGCVNDPFQKTGLGRSFGKVGYLSSAKINHFCMIIQYLNIKLAFFFFFFWFFFLCFCISCLKGVGGVMRWMIRID